MDRGDNTTTGINSSTVAHKDSYALGKCVFQAGFPAGVTPRRPNLIEKSKFRFIVKSDIQKKEKKGSHKKNRKKKSN